MPAKEAITTRAQTEAGMVGADDPVVCGQPAVSGMPVLQAPADAVQQQEQEQEQDRHSMHALQLIAGGAQR
ncbi:hypothetical protein [Streptomyces sp. NPDC001978]|uniref:hypothetical protein n=1 Tax=Streptomyces sp. NPDC001978 TaxID=3364627 RepID=UPI0036C794EC